jgi:hypothetical protein
VRRGRPWCNIIIFTMSLRGGTRVPIPRLHILLLSLVSINPVSPPSPSPRCLHPRFISTRTSLLQRQPVPPPPLHEKPPQPNNSTASGPVPNRLVRRQVAEQRSVRDCPALKQPKRRRALAGRDVLVYPRRRCRRRRRQAWDLAVAARRRSGGAS